ncbi:MAG: hypothetical protein DME19_19445 [Verrucomicrobia bacterium]|nr:MAG: hypothetical protein DME19_19445 [Verrucomicrobiota bacterium]
MGAGSFICGVVEGFYGRPWSAAQRRQLFAWMRSWGMNTYLYAPKDDLKHRLLWRELYPQNEADELEALIRDCQSQGLNFIYAIAPGLDISCSSRRDAAALRKKVSQLLELGCQQFAILFDDIQPVLSPEDAKAFESVASAQSFVANNLLQFLRGNVAAANLLFCPTPYCRSMSGPPRHSDYLRQIGKLLESSIRIFWTGPDIISETITVESIRELQRVIRRKPLLWDNLHANDYDQRRVYLGPYAGRPLELRDEVCGILSNPNCEFEANYVPLRTLAMYADADADWDPRAAYQSALKGWLLSWKTHKTGGISMHELELFCDCFYLPFQSGSRAEAFLGDLQHLLKIPPGDWGAAGRRFEQLCSDLDGLFDKMTALKNRDLLYALYRHVWELREEVMLLRKYLSWRKAKSGARPRYRDAGYRSGIFRGGLAAQLQRLLPMDEEGCFRHPSLSVAKNKSNGSRAL